MDKLQHAIFMRNSCRLWPTITTADRGYQIELLNRWEINVVIAQRELDHLRIRLMTS